MSGKNNPETHRRYFSLHEKEIREYQRIYRETHREQRRENERRRRREKRGFVLQQKKLHEMELKKEVLSYYGHGKCACVMCGYSDIRALSIDHINGGGCQHRKSLVGSHKYGGKNFYRWLKMNNFPLGYQTLCMNCQFVKRFGG